MNIDIFNIFNSRPQVEPNTKLTIEQWSKLYGIIVYDPDGFDRNDPYLDDRLFTQDEFERGLWESTIMIRPEKLINNNHKKGDLL